MPTDRANRPLHRAAWSAALLALAACGGGGGGHSGGDAAPGTDASATPPASQPAPGTVGDSAVVADATLSCGLPDFRAEALRRINAYRAAGAQCGARGSFPAAPALAWDERLASAAYAHARDMADHNYFSHTGRDGSSPGQRAADSGYAASAVGENIAAGYATVQAVVDGWMASDGHCANLMHAAYRDLGLACADGAGSTYGRYWALTLAAPR